VSNSFTNDDGARKHLGCSILGKPCDRSIWYSFRWATVPNHSQRLLRIFDRGQREEDRMLDMLVRAGAEVSRVDPATGAQYRADLGVPHLGGSLDAIAVLPPSLTGWAVPVRVVVECKTHGNSPFGQVSKKGVAAAYPAHYMQGMLYAYAHDIDYVLYMALNKNDETLYFELYAVDRVLAQRNVKRARDIISGETPRIFARISTNPTSFACKFCDHGAVCHFGGQPRVSCRSCRHVKPTDASEWYCGKWNAVIPTKDDQLKACQAWEQYD